MMSRHLVINMLWWALILGIAGGPALAQASQPNPAAEETDTTDPLVDDELLTPPIQGHYDWLVELNQWLDIPDEVPLDPNSQRRFDQLMELAQERFGHEGPLTINDVKLFRAAASGRPAAYVGSTIEEEQRRIWPETCRLSASRIVWLCTDPEASGLVDRTGLRVYGAKIDGLLDLSYAYVEFSIEFANCLFLDGLEFNQAHFAHDVLVGSGTEVPFLFGDQAVIDGNLSLQAIRARGPVRLRGAQIGGAWSCVGGKFQDIQADYVQVGQTLFMGERDRWRFEATGPVALGKARIGGAWDCSGGKFREISAVDIHVMSFVLMSKKKDDQSRFEAAGLIDMRDARIDGNWVCDGGRFQEINANRIEVDGYVRMSDGFFAQGDVRMADAKVDSWFCTKGRFQQIMAPRITVDAALFMNRGFEARSTVTLANATVGGNWVCRGGSFQELNAFRIDVGGDVDWSGVEVTSEARLHHATIGGNWSCVDGRFQEISAFGVHVEKHFRFFRVSHSHFASRDKPDPDQANGEEKTGANESKPWRPIDRLDLRSARVGTLADDEVSWPRSGGLQLDGFVYDRIIEGSPRDATSRLVWLERQPTWPFSPQPYEQLAKVLREAGLGDEADRVMIAKAEEMIRQPGVNKMRKALRVMLGRIITGYGYKPFRAIWIAAGFWLVGWWFFRLGDRNGAMMPLKEMVPLVANAPGKTLQRSPHYPRFVALIYSIDSFLPLINFQQNIFWGPNARIWCWSDNRIVRAFFSGVGRLFGLVRKLAGISAVLRTVLHPVVYLLWLCLKRRRQGVPLGWILCAYLWFHIAAGWLISTLLALAVTGVIKQ